MQIISKSKKRRIAARMGFLWFWLKSLKPGDFAIATEVLCNLCHDLQISWEDVHRASTAMAEAVAMKTGGKKDGNAP